MKDHTSTAGNEDLAQPDRPTTVASDDVPTTSKRPTASEEGSDARQPVQPHWFKLLTATVVLTAVATVIAEHWYSPVTGTVRGWFSSPPVAPSKQLGIIAGRAEKNYTIVSKNVPFSYGPKETVMVFTPVPRESGRIPAQLRIYSVPKTGHDTELYSFEPEVQFPRILGGDSTAPRRITRYGVDIGVRAIGSFNGLPGVQILIDLYDPETPALAAIPLLLSERLPTTGQSPTRFVLQPLLSPRSTGHVLMSRLLTSRCFRAGDWARPLQDLIYDSPVTIRQVANHAPLRSYIVSSYEYAKPTSEGQPAGTLALAAGYVARGGNIPSPSMLQILTWQIDLTGGGVTASTASGIPNLVRLLPSSTAGQIDGALKAVAHGEPPAHEGSRDVESQCQRAVNWPTTVPGFHGRLPAGSTRSRGVARPRRRFASD